jgi:hypothetical protein
MPALSNSQLYYGVETLITHGLQAKAQIILGKIGCRTDMLAKGRDLQQAWAAGREQAAVLEGQKIKATAEEEAAYQAAHAELSLLIEVVYILFNEESGVLNLLRLPRRRSPGRKTPQSQPAADETTAAAQTTLRRSYHSRARIKTLSCWQRLCANLHHLSPKNKAKLARYSWSNDRIEAAQALVKAVIDADLHQQRLVSALESQRALVKAAKADLLAWYRPIARLARKEIRKHPKPLRAQYYTLLGL